MSIIVNIGMWFERFVIIVTSFTVITFLHLGHLLQPNYLGSRILPGYIWFILYLFLPVF